MKPIRTYSRIFRACFFLVFRPFFRKRFFRLAVRGKRPDLSGVRCLLVVANHMSWWDGFLLFELESHWFPSSANFTFLKESTWKKNFWLRTLGGLPIDSQNPAALLRSLRHLKKVAEQSNTPIIVNLFPQGRIWPSGKRPLAFQSGIERLSRLLPHSAVLPVGMHLEPLTHAAPTALLSVGPLISASGDIAMLEKAVAKELDFLLGALAREGESLEKNWMPSADRSRQEKFLCFW